MGIFQRSKAPPVVFAWVRGSHRVRAGHLGLTDPAQGETWYPFDECYFPDGGAHSGEGRRSLYLRFAALTASRVWSKNERPPTNKELLRFADRYGLPDYLLPGNGQDMLGLRGGGYSPLWMTEDSRRMGGWLALWEAVANKDAGGARSALAGLRTLQTRHLMRPVINLFQPITWSLIGSCPPGRQGVPYHSWALFYPPLPTQEVRDALKGAALLAYRGMIRHALRSSGGVASDDACQVDLEAIRAAYAAMTSLDPNQRRQTFDLWDGVLQSTPGVCRPTDEGVLWFSEELLQNAAKFVVAQFSEPTTDVGFPGRGPANLQDAMYLMFGLDVLAGHLVKRCANDRCHWYPFFIVNDPRDQFCCQNCGSSDRVARSRGSKPKR